MANVSTVLMAFTYMMEIALQYVKKDIGQTIVLACVNFVEPIAKIALGIMSVWNALVLFMFIMANAYRSVHKAQKQSQNLQSEYVSQIHALIILIVNACTVYLHTISTTRIALKTAPMELISANYNAKVVLLGARLADH